MNGYTHMARKLGNVSFFVIDKASLIFDPKKNVNKISTDQLRSPWGHYSL